MPVMLQRVAGELSCAHHIFPAKRFLYGNTIIPVERVWGMVGV